MSFVRLRRSLLLDSRTFLSESKPSLPESGLGETGSGCSGWRGCGVQVLLVAVFLLSTESWARTMLRWAPHSGQLEVMLSNNWNPDGVSQTVEQRK